MAFGVKTITRLGLQIKKARGWRRALWAFGAGVGATLSMAPYYFLPLLLVGFCILVWLADSVWQNHKRRRFAGFATGWWFGFGYFLAGMYWMSFSFFVQADQFALLSPLALFGLPAFLALFPALAVMLALKFWRGDWTRVLVLAGFYSVFEYLRGHILTGLPWNLTSQALAGNALLPQLVAWLGPYGLGLMVLVIAALPAAMVLNKGDKLDIRPGLVSVLGFVAIVLFGVIRLGVNPTADNVDVEIRIVQPNIPQREKINWDLWQQNFMRHVDLSRFDGDAEEDKKLIVIWPENAVSLLAETTNARGVIADSLPENASLISGAVRRDTPSTDSRYYNSLLVLERDDNSARDASGFAAPMKVTASYDKFHLVPFGEYLPFYGLLKRFGLDSLAPVAEGFTPGAGLQTLEVAGLKFSSLICYEVIFPGRSYKKDDRPDFIVTITNDAWFGDTAGPRQHLDQARLRAIETGLPILRSANTGISAAIDAQGRITQRLGLYQQGAITTSLPQKSATPFYSIIGDWIYGLLLGAIVAFLWSRRRLQQKM
jgi:apolipoprotein N-acyltransferase